MAPSSILDCINMHAYNICLMFQCSLWHVDHILRLTSFVSNTQSDSSPQGLLSTKWSLKPCFITISFTVSVLSVPVHHPASLISINSYLEYFQASFKQKHLNLLHGNQCGFEGGGSEGESGCDGGECFAFSSLKRGCLAEPDGWAWGWNHF